MAHGTKKRDGFTGILQRLDTFQQRHKTTAIFYAVIKKYGDDEASYQAALIAYYGFLSLFPLLIVATAVIQIMAKHSLNIRDQFVQSISRYFPSIGSNLAASVHSPSKTGLALVIGLLITLYGSTGVASAIQHALDHIWAVPRNKRANFTTSLIRNLGIILFGGFGLIFSSFLTGYATTGHHEIAIRIIMWFSGFFVLYSVLWGVFTFGSSARKRPFANIHGALIATFGITVLEAVGSLIITHQLKGQSGLNAQFAVVLAILFWMYLQAEIVLYAIEYNTVHVFKLWPRSITLKPPLTADKKAYDLYRSRETFHPDESVGH